MRTRPLRGLVQVDVAADVAAARDWYRRLLGVEPYVQRHEAEAHAPVERRLGDHEHERGILDRRSRPSPGATMVVGVVGRRGGDVVVGSVVRLQTMSAPMYAPPAVRDEGFVITGVVEAFGGVLGPIDRPHDLAVARRGGRPGHGA